LYAAAAAAAAAATAGSSSIDRRDWKFDIISRVTFFNSSAISDNDFVQV